ncbi:hypothetical protein D3C71_1013100 [compost metagenome]
MRERPVKQRPRRGAQKLAGDENLEFVDQAELGKCTRQPWACLNQYLVDATVGELDQQLAQIYLTFVAGHDQAFRAGGILFFHGHASGDQCRTSLEERRIQRHPQAAVDQHTQRRTAHGQCRLLGIQSQFVGAHSQPGVVRQYRIGTGQYHTGLSAQTLNRRTCCRAGDPLALAAFHRGAAVQAHGQLDSHERQTVFHAFQKTLIELARLAFQHAAFGDDAGLFQALQSATGDFRIRVLHRRDHPRHTGIDQRIGAGRCAAMVAARLKRHISSGTASLIARRAQGVDFGMRFTGALMPAFADNLPIAHDHAADPRVGVRRVMTFARQFQGAGHEMSVEDGKFCGRGHSFTGSRARRSISSRNSLRSWKRRYTEAKRM